MAFTPFLLRLGIAGAFLCVPQAGLLPAAAMLVLLPLCCETMLAARERIAPSLAACTMGLNAWLVMPEIIRIPAMVWCAAALAMVWLPIGSGVIRRGLIWSLVTVSFLVSMLWLLHAQWQRPLAEGLAEALIDWFAVQPKHAQMLLTFWRSGYLPLQANAAEKTFLLMGSLLPQVEQQLLYALRTQVETLLRLTLPSAAILWCGLTGIACALIPDAVRGQLDGWTDLPPFSAWLMPRGVALGMGVFCFTSLLMVFSTSNVVATAGRLMETVFQLAYGVQGAAAIWWLLRERMSSSTLACCILLGLLTVLFPTALVLIGLFEQLSDFRHLRHNGEDADDNDRYDDF